MKFFRLLILFVFVQASAQQGGMWIPSLLEGTNESEMKNLGMKISAEQIYSINKSSIKDGIPHFDSKCTAVTVSPQGLILTNHHCGYDAIQNHSTVEHDYLTDGFWAYKKEDELLNKGMVVSFVVRIDDITEKVLEGTNSLNEAEKQRKINENIATLTRTLPKEAWQDNLIKTFYNGNQYLCFVRETFKDVRLVGAPPSSIGRFADVTDNWVWPRHTGDFSLFRIYADKNNRPAEYSAENVPYKPKYYFPISIKGLKENDFTMVLGYPGTTQEYLPAIAVDQIMNVIDPIKIELRDVTLKAQDVFMRKDNAIKIQYAAKNQNIANAWKKWSGEIKGLKKANAVSAKRKFEKEFQEKVIKAGKHAEYGNLLADFEKNYTEIKDYTFAKAIYDETVGKNGEILAIGKKLYDLEELLQAKGEDSFNERRNTLVSNWGDFYAEYNQNVDQKVFEELFKIYLQKYPKQFLPASLENSNPESLTNEIFTKSKLVSFEKVKELLTGDSKTVLEKLNNDKGYQVAKAIIEAHLKKVAPKYDEINLRITATQRTYMKGIIEMFPNGRIFPDANSTLRITYGKIKGYKPSDAVFYEPFSYLDGVIEKYIPGDYEFDAPKKLIDLYNAKDYGVYGVNGRMPLDFIATNHTTGGNSGSPALDAKGNLIGLNFDRVWEGTMSDIYYSPEICRNIMVDIRYVLFIMDKFAGAENLVNELKIIGSKKKKVKN
jgi:hypothetical protein